MTNNVPQNSNQMRVMIPGQQASSQPQTQQQPQQHWNQSQRMPAPGQQGFIFIK